MSRESSIPSNTNDQSQREIKSYVLRSGRMTDAQRNALRDNFQQWGLDIADGLIDPIKLCGKVKPMTMEIGFGMGDSLADMAEQQPEQLFLGVEVHRPGVGRLLSLVKERDLKNVRVFQADAVEVLKQCVAEASLDRVQIFFPDPWHKKKHHKRRLIKNSFLDLLSSRLRSGGVLHFASDWQPYAEEVLSLLQAHPAFENLSPSNDYVPSPAGRPETKFERRGKRLGHGVWDLQFQNR